MNIREWLIKNALNPNTIEDVLCLAFFLGKGKFTLDSDVQEWIEYWEKDLYEHCGNCPFYIECPACAFNE